MNKQRTQIILLIVLVVFGLIYAFGSYLLLPELTVIEGKQNQLQVKTAQHLRLLSSSDNPLNINKEILTKEVELAILAKVIPFGIDKPGLAYNILTAVNKNNLKTDNITFDKLENKGLYEVIGVSFTTTGANKDVFSLIQELQSGPDAFALRSVSFSAQALDMKADLKFQAYGRTGKNDARKQPFMVAPFGIDANETLFKEAYKPEPVDPKGSIPGFPGYAPGSVNSPATGIPPSSTLSPALLAPAKPASGAAPTAPATAPTAPATTTPVPVTKPPADLPQTGTKPAAPAISNPK